MCISRGRLVQDKSSKAPRLNCRNWECGVVIPVYLAGGVTEGESGIDSSLQALDRIVPIPMNFPGETMAGKMPWTMFDA
jgi:hypothetical protein